MTLCCWRYSVVTQPAHVRTFHWILIDGFIHHVFFSLNKQIMNWLLCWDMSDMTPHEAARHSFFTLLWSAEPARYVPRSDPLHPSGVVLLLWIMQLLMANICLFFRIMALDVVTSLNLFPWRPDALCRKWLAGSPPSHPPLTEYMLGSPARLVWCVILP